MEPPFFSCFFFSFSFPKSFFFFFSLYCFFLHRISQQHASLCGAPDMYCSRALFLPFFLLSFFFFLFVCCSPSRSKRSLFCFFFFFVNLFLSFYLRSVSWAPSSGSSSRFKATPQVQYSGVNGCGKGRGRSGELKKKKKSHTFLFSFLWIATFLFFFLLFFETSIPSITWGPTSVFFFFFLNYRSSCFLRFLFSVLFSVYCYRFFFFLDIVIVMLISGDIYMFIPCAGCSLCSIETLFARKKSSFFFNYNWIENRGLKCWSSRWGRWATMKRKEKKKKLLPCDDIGSALKTMSSLK